MSLDSLDTTYNQPLVSIATSTKNTKKKKFEKLI